MRFYNLLSGGNFEADTRISSSELNLTTIFGEGVSSSVFTCRCFNRGKSTYGKKNGYAKTCIEY